MVQGNIYGSGRMDLGATIFGCFRLTSNLAFGEASEIHGGSNLLQFDMQSTDISAATLAPPYQVYDPDTGIITVPWSGFYTLQMQGVFSNEGASFKNGVYYRLLNHSHSNARLGASISSDTIQSTHYSTYLLAGDLLQPTFYSDDTGATLQASNGETYVSFNVVSTVTPTHSNYYRV
jgi:hypothetical protein